MDDLSNVLISSGTGCFLDKVCFNPVLYADDLCLMAPCAIALQELLNICHSYSITVDVNFNALISFSAAFTPKLFKLRFPELNINATLIPYTDSIKYLGFTFTNSHKDKIQDIKLYLTLYSNITNNISYEAINRIIGHMDNKKEAMHTRVKTTMICCDR